MNLETIIQNINNWADLRNRHSIKDFLSLFEQGIGFYFKVPDDCRTEEDFESGYHAYPGSTDDGQLVFYLIHASRDTKEQFEKGILPYMVTCEITNDTLTVGNDSLPVAEAKQLIQNWTNYHVGWIPEQVISADGIYQAFFIPEEDIRTNERLKAYFALKPSNDPESNPFLADLIISDMKDVVISPKNAYADLARPVPPFKPGVLSENSFFLLECTVKDDYIRLG